MELILNGCEVGKSIWVLEGVGPGNLDFFGPFQGPKKSRFPGGPPLPMPLVMDLARLKTITYRAI